MTRVQAREPDLALLFRWPGRPIGLDHHGSMVCPDDGVELTPLLEDPHVVNRACSGEQPAREIDGDLTRADLRSPLPNHKEMHMNRVIRAWALAVAACFAGFPAVSVAAERPHAQAVDGVEGIAKAFDSYPLVAIGENHGDADQHAFLRRLIADERVLDKIDAIVIEWGSASHQRTIDRFVAGGKVSHRALAQSWRDSVGGGTLATWDSPIYEQFLRAVRRVNRSRPADRRVGVLLGDPAVPWRDIDRKGEVEQYLEQRETHFASVVDREVMRKNHRALIIAGVFHLLRAPNAPNRTAAELIDRQYPGKLFLVTLPAFDPAAEYPGFEYTRAWPTHSLVPLDGTDLGALRRPRPPGVPQAPTEEETADAWLTLTPGSRFSNAYPTSFDNRWWRELTRRVELDFGTFKPDEWFHVDCQYGDVAGRGLALATRERGRSGEPGASGPVAGQDPAGADAGVTIVSRLEAGKVVAVGDAGGLQQEHAILRTVLLSRQLRSIDPVIVVAFGNRRYQRLADRYMRGGRVPPAKLARTWQNTSQLLAYERNEYRQFFEAVREANRGRPARRKLRVLLGEPALDWRRASRADVRNVEKRRAAFMARLLRRHALSQKRGALLVADRDLVARSPGSVTSRLAAARSWVAEPFTGFAPGQADLEQRLSGLKPGTAMTVTGSWLARLAAGRNIAGDNESTLGDATDAVIYLGENAALTVGGPVPTLFRDRYVRQIERRHRLLFGRRFDPATAFPTSECRAPVESVGGGAPTS